MPATWGWSNHTCFSLVTSLYFLLPCPRLQTQTLHPESAPPNPRLWSKVRNTQWARCLFAQLPVGTWHAHIGKILHADSVCCSKNAVVAILGSKAKCATAEHLCLAAQSCPTLCNLMDCSPPSSSVHGDSPGTQLEETPETPPSSRAEGLLFLPGTAGPGGLLSTGSHRVGHD